ncbi:iron chaperone [Cohnella rhizosphaerae]|uniref:Iron chaperone n=1 Tax=Cohnella rhizosphaerae TaxID=1457232 RepID=A0A9X4KNF1_9BACL|nr:iron chaperone [Cohnella rhizosphaerae]MDG0808129.1 iron chaperone [Cohnella rhizosphaerae]
MEVFAEFLGRIDNLAHREKLEAVFDWIRSKFPQLTPKLAWNQPMFTDHGTFIIGFSAAKRHMAVALEKACMLRFANDIAQAGYESTKELVRIRWDSPLDYDLLEKMIAFNVADKADCDTFWRK